MRFPRIMLLWICVCAELLGARTAAAAEWLHEAEQGDTLWDLCLAHTNKPLCWVDLQKYNAIRNDRRIPVGTVIRVPADWLKEPFIVGGVLEANGEVTVSELDSNDFGELATEQPVYLGDHVRTGEGNAFLELISGLMVMLRPNSLMVLDSFSDATEAPIVELSLEHGSMEVGSADSEPATGDAADLTVSTQAAAAEIGGAARINSGADGARTLGESLRGDLNLNAQGNVVEVPAGYGASVTPGAAPSAPQSLPAAPQFVSGFGNSFNPVVLAWGSDQSPASAWHIDVYAASSQRKLLQSELVTASGITLDNLAIGCYTLALRAVAAEGFQGLEQRAPLCVFPSLAAPALRLVDKGSRKRDARLTWDAVPHAVRYAVDVAEDADFTRIIEHQEVTATEYAITLSKSAERHVRVRALNEVAMAGPISETVRLEQLSCSKVAPLTALAAMLLVLL